MNATLGCSEAGMATGAASSSPRLFSALSCEKSSRQVVARQRPGSAPKRQSNPTYLKHLEQAELPSWESSSAQPRVAPLFDPVKTPRLPSPAPARGEGRLYAILAVTAVLILAYELWGTLDTAGNWKFFAQFVRQLLG